MAKEKTNQVDKSGKPELRSTVATKMVEVKLSDIKSDADRFCHRDPDSLKSEAVAELRKSIAAEGLQTPIEVVPTQDDKYLLVKGHRRIEVLRQLSDAGKPGFAKDMLVLAVEVSGAKDDELLLRSILDNDVRLNFTQIERIKIAKKLIDNNVSQERAAAAFGRSVKTLERDLMIARNQRVLKLVEEDKITPTHAYSLLFAASKAKRAEELESHLEHWIASQEEELKKQDHFLRKTTGKGLSQAARSVKNRIADFFPGWMKCLQEGRDFYEANQDLSVGHIDLAKYRFQLEKCTADLRKDDLSKLAKLASRLSLLSKQLVPIIHFRRDIELTEGPQAQALDFSEIYDEDFLEDNRLGDLVLGDPGNPLLDPDSPEHDDDDDDDPDAPLVVA